MSDEQTMAEFEALYKEGKAKRIQVTCPTCAQLIRVRGLYVLLDTGEIQGKVAREGIYA